MHKISKWHSAVLQDIEKLSGWLVIFYKASKLFALAVSLGNLGARQDAA